MQGRVFIDGNIVGVGLCAVRATYIALLVVLSTAVVLTAINYYPAHVNRHLLKWSFRQRLCETAPRKNSLLDLHCIAIQIDLLVLFQHIDGLLGEQLLMLEYLIWVEDLERVRTTSVGLARASICSWSLGFFALMMLIIFVAICWFIWNDSIEFLRIEIVDFTLLSLDNCELKLRLTVLLGIPRPW